MTIHKIRFTKEAIAKIVPPSPRGVDKGGVYDTYRDNREKGLVLLVSNGGAKTFYVYMKFNGRPKRFKIGSAIDIPIEQVRKIATQKRALASEGKNPNEQREALRDEMTFGELFRDYMNRYSKVHKKSWRYDEREVQRFLKHLFNRPISSITKTELLELHETIGKQNGKTQANRILERIRAIYNKGIEWGLNIKNPTQGIKRFRELSRTRFILPEEMPYFWQALDLEDNEQGRDFLKICILTGARKSNVLSMRWNDINFQRAEWHIPETKNGESLVVHLSLEVMAVIKDIKSFKSSEWVFPSLKASGGHFTDPSKTWIRVKKRATVMYWKSDIRFANIVNEIVKSTNADLAICYPLIKTKAKQKGVNLPVGLMDVRLHDLRRTFGSWQAIGGSTTTIIGKTLGHNSLQSTRVYERLTNDAVKQSVLKTSAALAKRNTHDQ